MNYILMHKERSVLSLEFDEVTGGIMSIGELSSPEHVPVGIGMSEGVVDRADLNHWWLGRSIPASRSGLREALEQLQISSPQMLLSKCYGLSLSDQYWVMPEGQELCWSEINFFENVFSEDVGNILFGMSVDSKAVDLRSPDNTSDGVLRKRWKIVNGKRCLIKGGSAPFYQEPLNEVFASKLMERLRIPHVHYSLMWIDGYPYSVCPDFVTPDTELVSAHHIMKAISYNPERSKYQHYLQCCDALGIPDVVPSLDQMLTLDFLLANDDRHTNNFGALRNADTLVWLGPAPVFDCGTSLWHDSLFRWGGPEEDCPSKPFAQRHSEQITHVQSFDWLNFSALDGVVEDFEEILASAPRFVDDMRRTTLCEGFQERIKQLHEHVQTLDFGGTNHTMKFL